MTDLTRLTAADLAARLASREVSSVEATQAHLDRIAAVDGAVHAFLHVSTEDALRTARDVDARRAAGDELHPLAGVPIAVKDIVVTRGMPTTAGSKILEGWLPPYDATVTTRLRDGRLCPSSARRTWTSSPWGRAPSTPPTATRTTRGTSTGSPGGPAVARPPPSPPTRRRSPSARTPAGPSVSPAPSPGPSASSRPTAACPATALIALASSLDQAGPVTRTVLDSALLHELIGGHDPRDSTSIPEPLPPVVAAARAGANGDLTGVRVGVVTELGGEGYQPGVRARFEESLELLRGAGAEIVEVSCPHFTYALGAYYLILPSEASSNLAKFDGMRFGLRVEPTEGPVTAERVMSATRGAGFGDEVKRRIILGTYALSAGYYDAYYGSAQKVRTLIQRDFAAAFERADVLVSPTAPTTAFRLGEKLDDPLAMYLNDVATIPANLAGVPGMSVPNGRVRRRPARRPADPRPREGGRPVVPRRRRAGGAAREHLGGAAAEPRTGAGGRPDEHPDRRAGRLRRGDRPVRPGDRHRGARRARHAHQDVRRRPADLRRGAQHRRVPGVPRPARGAAGTQRHRGGVRDPHRPGAQLHDRGAVPVRAEELLLPGRPQELPDVAVRRAHRVRRATSTSSSRTARSSGSRSSAPTWRRTPARTPT